MNSSEKGGGCQRYQSRVGDMSLDSPPLGTPVSTAKQVLRELDTFAVILDPKLQLVYANPAARHHSPITGSQLSDPRFVKRAKKALRKGMSATVPPRRGEDPPLRMHLIPLDDGHLVVFFEDLGQEQRVNAMRRDFIANVSHELKTPISAIGLLAEALLEGAEDPDVVREFGTQLLQEARRLGVLTQDIIQLSGAQAGFHPEDWHPVDLRAVVEQEVETHSSYAEQKQIAIELRRPANPARPALVLGDTSRISSVLDNLLSNAVRYSPPGGTIAVTMTFEKDTMMVAVSDEGDGIPVEHQHRIFERFYRVDKSRSRDGGGTGLGLSIAHNIMRGLGGTIDLWSRPAEGSQFTLTFPLIEEKHDD